jgi:NitT/TauT family transport system substrate-binding protein
MPSLLRLIGVGVFAAGCHATQVQAQAKESTSIVVAEIARNLAYAPLYAALSTGEFRKEGLDVQIKTTWGPGRTMASFSSGEAQIMLQGPEAAIYIENGTEPKKARIFASLVATPPMVLVSRKPIASADFKWGMLRGKTIIGRHPGRTPGFVFERALRNNGLIPGKDVKYVSTLPVPVILKAWGKGQGDFIVAFDPAPQVFRKEGTGYTVASIGKEVGRVDFTVLIVSREFISHNRRAVQGFTNAVAKALDWAATSAPDEMAEAISSFFPRFPKPVVARAMQRYRDLDIWKKHPLIEKRAVAEVQSMMIESGVMAKDQRVPYESIVDPQFAENAKRAAGR